MTTTPEVLNTQHIVFPVPVNSLVHNRFVTLSRLLLPEVSTGWSQDFHRVIHGSNFVLAAWAASSVLILSQDEWDVAFLRAFDAVRTPCLSPVGAACYILRLACSEHYREK